MLSKLHLQHCTPFPWGAKPATPARISPPHRLTAAASQQPPRSVDPDSETLLSWSASESPVADRVGEATTLTQQQQQRQQRQQQSWQAAPHQRPDRQQQQQRGRPQSKQHHSPGQPVQDGRRSSSSSRPVRAGSSSDHYLEAQQRVRSVLAAADPANPAAAAEQLPNTVNDLTTALQLLATARRPSTLPAYRQYDAATQQLAAAVLHKYKQLLLPQQARQHTPDQQQHLGAALASLPATKLAAAAFSLGALRLYDRQLVQGLEAASLLLMQRDAFRPNQLGQIVQGFVYLDHQLNPEWHAGFIRATLRHLGAMQNTQLASLAVWLTSYVLCSNAAAPDASSSSSSSLAASSAVRQLAPGNPAAVAAAAAAAVSQASVAGVELDSGWVAAYLMAVGRQAGSLKPLQLMQVLQAAVALHQHHQQQQLPRPHLAMQWDIPVSLKQLGRGRAGQDPQTQQSSSAATCSSWVLPLVAAVQRQLPELTMCHLAAVLPALLVLTARPWPRQLLQPVLLQVKLQLPSCAGEDLVAVAQAVAQLAGPQALAAEQEWTDAVLVQLHGQLPLLGPAQLAGAVHAVALLRVKPYSAWVYELCARLRVDGRAFDADQVLVVLEGLVAVGVQLDPEVLHVFVLQIKRWMGSWGVDELGRVAGALRAMYPRVLPGRTVQQLVEELQRRQQFLALQAAQQDGRFGSF